MADLRNALVTGANKGIGKEIARRLLEQGYTVWLGCRDYDRGEAAAAEMGNAARLLQIDVTDDASVLQAAKILREQTSHLDVLVNNAGIISGPRVPPSEDAAASVRSVYEVNVFGPIRVTQAFLPLLKASAAARIVMMSSGLGSLAGATDPASMFYDVNLLGYNSSKAALNMVTVAFAKELAGFGIKVNAADPGYTATDLNGHNGHRTVEQGAEIAVRLATLGADGPNAGYFDESGPVAW